mgnify:CR=1 FL=1
MRKQTAKFFCESCGEEVPQNARVCAHCGRFFSSVRCPVCGETGNPNKFSDGCPKCGYAFEPDKKVDAPKARAKKPSRRARRRFLAAIDLRSSPPGRRVADETLPVWMYALTGGVFLAFIFGFFLYFGQ